MFCCSTLLAQHTPSGWYRLDGDLNKIRFGENGSIFICGSNGVILRSLDTGKTWQQPVCEIKGAMDNVLNDITDINGDIVIAVGENNTIVRSTDNGLTWKQLQSVTSTANLTAILNVSGGICLVGEVSGVFLRSTDYGQTWNQVKTPMSRTIREMYKFGSDIFALGDCGEISLSKNNGLSWNIVNKGITGCSDNSPHSRGLNIIKLSDGTLWAYTSNASFFSSDNGMTWFLRNPILDNVDILSVENIALDKTFIAINNVGTGGLIAYNPKSKAVTAASFASGVSFTTSFSNIRFISGSTGFAIGDQKSIFKTTDSGATWNAVSYLEKCNIDQSNGGALQIQDSTNFFFIGLKFGVFHSHNAGATWLPNLSITLFPTEDGSLRALHFFDKDSGIVVHTNNFTSMIADRPNGVFTTNDGGNTFNNFNEFDILYANHVYFSEKYNGFSIGYFYVYGMNFNRSCYHFTSDGGLNWKQSTIYHDSVQFMNCTGNQNNQLICGAKQTLAVKDTNGKYVFSFPGAIIYRTTDNGTTWLKQSFSNIRYLLSIAFTDENTAIAVGWMNSSQAGYFAQKGVILKTTNGGDSWFVVDSTVSSELYAVCFYADGKTGYAAGPGLFLTTTDAGTTWSKTAFDTYTQYDSFSNIQADTQSSVIISGSGGRLYRNIPAQTQTSVAENKIELGFGVPVWLRAPFPNPFSEKIHLQALWQSTMVGKNISIKVYTTTGEIIADLSSQLAQLNEESSYSEQTIEWEPKNLSAGMYYIVIQGGGFAKAMPVFYMGE